MIIDIPNMIVLCLLVKIQSVISEVKMLSIIFNGEHKTDYGQRPVTIGRNEHLVRRRALNVNFKIYILSIKYRPNIKQPTISCH